MHFHPFFDRFSTHLHIQFPAGFLASAKLEQIRLCPQLNENVQIHALFPASFFLSRLGSSKTFTSCRFSRLGRDQASSTLSIIAAFRAGEKRRKTDARSMSRAAVGELCHARRRKTSVAQLSLSFRLPAPAPGVLTLLRAPIRGFASKPAPPLTLLVRPLPNGADIGAE